MKITTLELIGGGPERPPDGADMGTQDRTGQIGAGSPPIGSVPKMTAADIRAALHRRFPDQSYVTIEEAPTGPWRNGGIDLVAISCWASKKYEIDAFEIKISYSDWKRERENPWKNAWWADHAHRIWLACPSVLAPRIAPELFPGWGLLSVGSNCTVYIKPEKRTPEPMEWKSSVGLMRALAGASYNGLDRAYAKGYDEGRLHEQARGGMSGVLRVDDDGAKHLDYPPDFLGPRPR